MSGPLIHDRVRETSTTTGTGAFTLAGAVTGFRSFSIVGNNNTCYYCIQAVNSRGVPTGDWEVGIGTYTLVGTVLSRDTVLASSSGGAAVNFAAGTKDVMLTAPAAHLSPMTTTGDVIYQAADGRATRLPIGTANQVLVVSAGLPVWATVSSGVTDHGDLTGLADDDHAQYALLAGRVGGQTFSFNTASGGGGTVHSTSHATKGTVTFHGVWRTDDPAIAGSAATEGLKVTNANNTVFEAPYANNNDYVYIRNLVFVSTAFLLDGSQFSLGVSAGTLWGMAANQKQAWWGATPVVQPTAVPDASGGTVIDVEARAALNDLLARLRTLGLIAT